MAWFSFHCERQNKVGLGICFIEKGQNLVRPGIYFILKKWQNKVRLGIYFIENAEIRYSWDLFYWKGRNKVRLEIYFIKKVEIRYGRKLILLKMLRWGTT